MNDDILTTKLRQFAERGNIEMNRCIEIAHAAQDALVEQSKGGELPQLAAAMFRCCGTDEDEAAYFRCAVDSLLQNKWRAKPQDSAVLTGMMNMSYQGIVGALRTDWADKATDGEDPDTFTITTPLGAPSMNPVQDAIQFGITLDRHKWLVDHAKSAVESFAKSQEIDTLALTMVNCCDSTEELKFYSYAVKAFFWKIWSDQEKATQITNLMGHRAIQIAEARPIMEQKSNSSGCGGVATIGLIGLAALGYYVGQVLFA